MNNSLIEEALSRPFTDEELRELSRRTKVKVKMNAMNCVWDAVLRYEKDNDRAVRVVYYSDQELAEYKAKAAAANKLQNINRLDRWRRQRLEEDFPSIEEMINEALEDHSLDIWPREEEVQQPDQGYFEDLQMNEEDMEFDLEFFVPNVRFHRNRG
ncbi:telomere-binding protein cav-like [Drosophila ficusphila]|uniref:telomere-binding protein cav-like n=1 Tax=Drosophila ficusphila TaxID=30025 RepID=UPI001C8AC205|nr:telomere-binding protein cav-like [Drosophila ficusphila]